MTSPRMYALVKPRGMWTGLITVSASVKPERGAHQDRVLVGGLAVDDRVALADRLGEADVQAAVVQRREQAEGDGGLAAVHAGRGEVELSHSFAWARRLSCRSGSRAARCRSRTAKTPTAMISNRTTAVVDPAHGSARSGRMRERRRVGARGFVASCFARRELRHSHRRNRRSEADPEQHERREDGERVEHQPRSANRLTNSSRPNWKTNMPAASRQQDRPAARRRCMNGMARSGNSAKDAGIDCGPSSDGQLVAMTFSD